MKLISFAICLLLSITIISIPLFIALYFKSDISIACACLWFLIIGASNKWIQKLLEEILN